ncbi:hypothetical protein PHJA_000467800 [Phtheirospermum japonicum]|uniref:Uncharacterized protein n=1 Tax=Phtheirospermum japonicum TaxID=374723 RepID=A0A830BEP7_9LAMI|nr:hypothetical protein PHJA_000467800 [Phtheirospermum japonicum]
MKVKTRNIVSTSTVMEQQQRSDVDHDTTRPRLCSSFEGAKDPTTKTNYEWYVIALPELERDYNRVTKSLCRILEAMLFLGFNLSGDLRHLKIPKDTARDDSRTKNTKFLKQTALGKVEGEKISVNGVMPFEKTKLARWRLDGDLSGDWVGDAPSSLGSGGPASSLIVGGGNPWQHSGLRQPRAATEKWTAKLLPFFIHGSERRFAAERPAREMSCEIPVFLTSTGGGGGEASSFAAVPRQWRLRI